MPLCPLPKRMRCSVHTDSFGLVSCSILVIAIPCQYNALYISTHDGERDAGVAPSCGEVGLRLGQKCFCLRFQIRYVVVGKVHAVGACPAKSADRLVGSIDRGSFVIYLCHTTLYDPILIIGTEAFEIHFPGRIEGVQQGPACASSRPHLLDWCSDVAVSNGRVKVVRRSRRALTTAPGLVAFGLSTQCK